MYHYEAQGWGYPSEKANPLWPESEFYFQAWLILRSEAPPAFGFASIPWTAIYSYAVAHGELPDIDILTQMVWALDNKLAQIQKEKREIEEARAQDGRPNNPNRT